MTAVWAQRLRCARRIAADIGFRVLLIFGMTLAFGFAWAWLIWELYRDDKSPEDAP